MVVGFFSVWSLSCVDSEPQQTKSWISLTPCVWFIMVLKFCPEVLLSENRRETVSPQEYRLWLKGFFVIDLYLLLNYLWYTFRAEVKPLLFYIKYLYVRWYIMFLSRYLQWLYWLYFLSLLVQGFWMAEGLLIVSSLVEHDCPITTGCVEGVWPIWHVGHISSC